jgi:putative CRISPR-associated protein (TIGR02619 family)
VGTSLLVNIGKLEAHEPNFELKRLLDEGNIAGLAKALAKLSGDARICGAEINSINDAIKHDKVSLTHLYLMVSDTEEGKKVGKILETYFIERGIDGLQNVEVKAIEDLQDADPKKFKTKGLRNLVRELGRIVRQYDASSLVIDATGGYKAQIAIAVVFGQALQIPVLYRHERFSEIIDFPPMPIGFDYELLGRESLLLAQFERGEALTRTEIEDLDETLRVLLEEVEVDGEDMFEMGAVGQIFLEGFRARFPKSARLAPVPDDMRKTPTFRDDHYPQGFKAFVTKLCEVMPWIKSAHSLPYDKQKSIHGTGAYVSGEGKLVGTYQDKDKFGARFEIMTDAETSAQFAWAADQINQYVRDNF